MVSLYQQRFEDNRKCHLNRTNLLRKVDVKSIQNTFPKIDLYLYRLCPSLVQIIAVMPHVYIYILSSIYYLNNHHNHNTAKTL